MLCGWRCTTSASGGSRWKPVSGGRHGCARHIQRGSGPRGRRRSGFNADAGSWSGLVARCGRGSQDILDPNMVQNGLLCDAAFISMLIMTAGHPYQNDICLCPTRGLGTAHCSMAAPCHHAGVPGPVAGAEAQGPVRYGAMEPGGGRAAPISDPRVSGRPAS